jgi:hypothetical protein
MSEVLLNLLNNNLLETMQTTYVPPRRACISDFLEDTCHNKTQNYSQHDNISKNQQEFGHRKRIKP